MELTKLEIKGFKSFGDKVTINFDKGITGIVGPNGCGKSNVVDSIRWVLGEQKTKALRSDKMENVIFNGTKNRKPSQMAEVSLTFNNTRNLLPTEYSQVTITRRYYRSGESEYLLNGVTCRLKDISNLFLDTGIASNSYAIIELKMVDDLLNDKDNSRRQLFEEAAGISKFKVRKKETMRKLGDTDADLERVEDLLFEIEKNLKSLEKQAKQTERYFKLKEEYKLLSIAYAKKSIVQQRETFLTINKQIEGESDRKVSIQKQIAEKEAAVEKLKADLISKEKLLASRQKSLNEHVGKIRQYESDKKIKNERLRFLNDKSENLREQLFQDKKSNERAAFSLQSLEQEKISAEKLLSETLSILDESKKLYEEQKSLTQELQAQSNTNNAAYKQGQEEVYQLKKSVEIKQIQLSTLKQEMEKTTSDTSSQTANLQEFEQKVAELKTELEKKTQTYNHLKAKEEALNQRIGLLEKTIEVVREEMTQTSRKLDARQNEFNLTKSLVENLEGFPEAIKFLKKNSSWGKNAPLLSDIITCDDKYRVTIENYLEPYMNYYVVETEAQAYQAVNLLSDAAKGKAHFFVLDSFDRFSGDTMQFYENAVPATEIVEYDSKYKKLVAYILDKVYIVTGDHYNIPSDENSIFITLSGKVTKRRHSISGGSVGLFEGKRIGRAKNLEKLEKEIKDLQKKQNEVKSSLDEKVAELQKLKENTQKEALEILQQEISLVNQEYVTIRTKHEQFAEMLSNNASKRENLIQKIEELSEQLMADEPACKVKEEDLLLLEEKIQALTEELQMQQEVLSQRSTAFNQQNIQYHQQENKRNSIIQEISFKKQALESSQERIEKNQAELVQTESEIRLLLEKNEVNEDELVEMYREKERIENGLNEAEKDFYQCRGDIDTAEKEGRELQRQKEQADNFLMELQNTLNEAKIKMSSVKERLNVEFNIELDQLMEESPDQVASEEDNLSENELKERVNQVKDKLEKMGPINPMAMEAYEEIKERFDFITAQKEDLLKAKASLLDTISEIDEVARVTFIEAFDKIKANFMKVFRSLFTEEDDCDLRLTYPDDPLESSIDIIAKPKGKRPLTINQLSGGEKTLTATSLLFAIYLLKPAPFCIFDEVDAPLDDANIDKFNNIIRTFSDQSQFIIVTHNKRTMASTDIIYGITMIEQGVSRVVPVDLRELSESTAYD